MTDIQKVLSDEGSSGTPAGAAKPRGAALKPLPEDALIDRKSVV